MPKIKLNELEFLDAISHSVINVSGFKGKLSAVTKEYWHAYSTGWKNLIISINKNVFEIHNSRPLRGLKESFMNKAEYKDEREELIDSFRGLIRNWDDVFGDSYYNHPKSLITFVLEDTVKTLSSLGPFVDSRDDLNNIIGNYKKCWDIKHE